MRAHVCVPVTSVCVLDSAYITMCVWVIERQKYMSSVCPPICVDSVYVCMRRCVRSYLLARPWTELFLGEQSDFEPPPPAQSTLLRNIVGKRHHAVQKTDM